MQRAVSGKGDLAALLAENCLTPAAGLTKTELALAYDIVRVLIGSADISVRRHLAAYLAERDDLPEDVVLSLVHDDIAVAYPILVHNKTVSDDVLIDVVANCTSHHQMAISVRNTISKNVSKALVATKDCDVIESLLFNKSAGMDAISLDRIIEMFGDFSAFHLPLVRRRELSGRQANLLSGRVSGSLRRHLMSHFDLESETV
jgi:uncharacterized protein (DUF2336 family)